MTALERIRWPARVDVRWLWVAATAVFINTSYGTLSYAFSVFVTKDGPGGTFGEGVVSAGYALAIVVSGIAGIFSGTVADLFGTRRVMAGGAFVGACGLALLGVCHEAWEFLLVMALILGPAVAATFYEPIYVLMNRWFLDFERPRAYGVLTLLSGVSITIFTPLTRGLVATMGWREAMGVLAVVLFAIGLVVPLLLTEPMAPSERHHTGTPRSFLHEVRDGLRHTDSVFWLFSAGYVAGTMAYSGYQFHIVAELEGRGFQSAAVAAAVGITGLVSLPGRLLLPAMAHRVASSLMLGVCFVALAVAAWLASMADAWWQVWLFVVLFGLVFGAVNPLRGLALSERFAGSHFGRVLAIQTLFVAIAHGLGPVIISWIGTDRADYELGFRLAAVVLLGSGVLTWWSMHRAAARSRDRVGG